MPKEKLSPILGYLDFSGLLLNFLTRRGRPRDAPSAAHGDIIVPPVFASTLLFALGVIVVQVLDVSSLHLLWWFPVTFVPGIVVLTFPTVSTAR